MIKRRELYIDNARENLAAMFDYLIYDYNLQPDYSAKIFTKSFGDLFDAYNPGIIAGKSGIELAKISIKDNMGIYPTVKYSNKGKLTDAYWAGDYLAYYHSISNYKFRDIFLRVSMTEILEMYNIYHEMSEKRFSEEMDIRISKTIDETRLAILRKRKNYSQGILSRYAEVNIRNIQLWEQKVNDINKAEAMSLKRIAYVLNCDIEDLLESK